MTTRNFMQLLHARQDLGFSVCVGLDADYAKIPSSLRGDRIPMELSILSFLTRIVDETHPLVCAYKPNAAFFERLGPGGWELLRQLVDYINNVAPEIPIIYDAKRGDIGNSSEGYAHSAFSLLGADAITVNPYMGMDSVAPFLKNPNKGVFVLVRTSNPGAKEFQDLAVNGEPLFIHIARRVANFWNSQHHNCGVVAGATSPRELAMIRRAVGDLDALIPGIGAQGGEVESTVLAGMNSMGTGMIINSSRGVLYASPNEDFALAAGAEVQKLHGQVCDIQAHRLKK